jgi:hypothetical protein
MISASSSQTIDWEHTSWQEAYAEVSRFTDRLGLPVDAGIFETVVLLNLLGFRTSQSCEGHLDHGAMYPWVDVIDASRSSLFTKQWVHVCELEEQARRGETVEVYNTFLEADIRLRVQVAQWEADDPLFAQLVALLDAFYTEQERPLTSARLLLKRFRSPGVYRIAPGFSQEADRLPDQFKAAYLRQGQAEMQAFTTFLKQCYQARNENTENI